MGLFAVLLAFVAFLNISTLSHAQAACTKPSVRKEWRALSLLERADWIRAVNCLAKLPHDDSLTPSVDPSISVIPPVNTSGSYYDDIAYVHMDLNVKIHFTGLFLPWHRWYVAVYEQKLHEKCGYRGASPYWDWTLDAADIQNSTIFESTPFVGLGKWGDPKKDYSIKDGGFSQFHLSYPSPHILRRNYTAQPWLAQGKSDFVPDPEKYAGEAVTPAEIEGMVGGYVGNFTGFQSYLEGFQGAHGAMHLVMGGDMGGTCPQNAPANCVGGPKWSVNGERWWDWQHRDAANFWAFHGGSVAEIDTMADYEKYPTGAPPYLTFNSTTPGDGLLPEYSLFDMWNTTGGALCYVYQ